jgi:predicted peroxiredoxin
MKSNGTWISILFAATAICTGATLDAAAQETRDGVFIHVSHGADDPHRVLMALSMADIMSEDQDVLVYFDIKGIDVVLKNAPNLTYAHFTSSQEQLTKLSKKGVVLMACPGCLKAAGKTKDDLATGIRIADKKVFFSFTKGRILTLDY